MKTKKFKKPIAVILALIMLITSVPMTAFAENVSENSSGTMDANASGTVYSVGGKDYELICDRTSTAEYRKVYYFYSDGYFAENPSKLNSHLATMSMSLAMASYPVVDTASQTPYKSQASKLTEVLTNIGCEDIEVSDDYQEETSADSAAFVLAKKELKTKYGESTGKYLVAVVPRSANFESEWISTFTLGANGEAEGVSECADEIMEGISKYLSDKKLPSDSSKTLQQAANEGNVVFWVSGYSRGASVANLVAKRIIDTYTTKASGVYKNPVFAYCLGPFRAGAETDKSGNSLIKKNDLYKECIHNYTTVNDAVTRLIPYDDFVLYGSELQIINPDRNSSKDADTEIADQLSKVTSSKELKRGFKLKYVKFNLFELVTNINNLSYETLIADVPDSTATMSDFMDAFIYYIVEWEAKTRADYSSTKRLDCTVSKKKYGKTVQEALSTYIKIIMDMGLDNLDPVIWVLEGKKSGCKEGYGIVDRIKRYCFVYNIFATPLVKRLLEWSEQNESQKIADANTILGFLTDCYYYDENDNKVYLKDVLGDANFAKAEEYFPYMTDVVMDFVSRDYAKEYVSQNTSKLNLPLSYAATLTATIIDNVKTYKSSLFTSSQSKVYQAALMAEDSFYDDSLITSLITNNGEVVFAGKLPSNVSKAELTVYKSGGKAVKSISLNEMKTPSTSRDVFDFTSKVSISSGDSWKLELLDSSNKIVSVYSSGAQNEGDVIENKFYGTDGSLLSGNIGNGSVWLEVVKDKNGKTTKINAELSDSTKKAIAGVFTSDDKFVGTAMVEVGTDGLASIDLSSLNIPAGGYIKLFSTGESYDPKFGALLVG